MYYSAEWHTHLKRRKERGNASNFHAESRQGNHWDPKIMAKENNFPTCYHNKKRSNLLKLLSPIVNFVQIVGLTS